VAGLSATALLGAGVAAWAADVDRPVPTPARTPPQAKTFIARQHVEARVTRVDQRRNTLTLETGAGNLHLDATPVARMSVKPGDSVVLQIGILPSPRQARAGRGARAGPAAQRSPAGEETDQAVVRQQLDAEVAGVDLVTGVVTLKSAAGIMTLELPGRVAAAFRPGEVCPVELAVSPAPRSQPTLTTPSDGSRRAGLAALILSIFGRKR
jgi:hypothetical protein